MPPVKDGATDEIAPVVASNSTSPDRAVVVVACSSLTEVNVPPTTMVLPTCRTASTSPSLTQGVVFGGTAEIPEPIVAAEPV